MSVDIWTEEAFLLKFTEFVGLLKPEHLSGIKGDAVRLLRKRMAYADDASTQSRVSRYTAVLKSAETIGNVADFLISLVKSCVLRKKERFAKETSRFVFSDEEDPDDSPEIELIRCICRIVFPLEPESVVLFWSYRQFQTSATIREPLILFPLDDCFERRMTDAGEAMARALGKTSIEPDEWVVTC